MTVMWIDSCVLAVSQSCLVS